MILVVVACVATCVLTSLLTLALTGSLRRSEPAEAQVQTQVDGPPAAPRSREEDRVRPAINPAGERIWVDEDDIEWHEIVSWTLPAEPTDVQLADLQPADVQQQVSSPEHRTA